MNQIQKCLELKMQLRWNMLNNNFRHLYFCSLTCAVRPPSIPLNTFCHERKEEKRRGKKEEEENMKPPCYQPWLRSDGQPRPLCYLLSDTWLAALSDVMVSVSVNSHSSAGSASQWCWPSGAPRLYRSASACLPHHWSPSSRGATWLLEKAFLKHNPRRQQILINWLLNVKQRVVAPAPQKKSDRSDVLATKRRVSLHSTCVDAHERMYLFNSSKCQTTDN